MKPEEDDKNIPSLTDGMWQEKEELGYKEEIIKYQSGTTTKKVKVRGKILSGSALQAIEGEYITVVDGEPDLNANEYERAIMKAVLGISGTEFQKILDNKSSDLRNKLRTFCLNLSGSTMKTKEVEAEKNSESPDQSKTSSP